MRFKVGDIVVDAYRTPLPDNKSLGVKEYFLVLDINNFHVWLQPIGNANKTLYTGDCVSLSSAMGENLKKVI